MAKPDIRLKRVYDPPSAEDGFRVLVDRLWPRGLKKEAAALDLWMKEIGPSNALRKWFGHDPARWEEFRTRYRAELDERSDLLAQLRLAAARSRLTLLYGARDAVHNQAVALREVLLARG
jgi:uncharacterized protein YeaO (DUF488 family)